jgi:hypothetical protein
MVQRPLDQSLLTVVRLSSRLDLLKLGPAGALVTNGVTAGACWATLTNCREVTVHNRLSNLLCTPVLSFISQRDPAFGKLLKLVLDECVSSINIPGLLWRLSVLSRCEHERDAA